MNCLNLMILGMYEEFCVYFDAALRAESKQQRFCLLCSINDLDREGLSNHNSSWWSVRWMDGRFMLFLLSKFFSFFLYINAHTNTHTQRDRNKCEILRKKKIPFLPFFFVFDCAIWRIITTVVLWRFRWWRRCRWMEKKI